MMNFTSNKQARDQAKLAKLADPALVERRRRRAEGDWLDKAEIRDRADNARDAMLLGCALGFSSIDMLIEWLAGIVVFPQLKIGDVPIGGVTTCVNAVAFIWLVHRYVVDGREFRANPNGLPALTLFVFSVLFIWVSQTTAADDVQVIVDKRTVLDGRIATLEAEIPARVIRARAPVEANLEEALNQAVGSHLSRRTEDEAAAMCAKVVSPVERMACRQQALREMVDCAQDMKPVVREATCTPIAAYRASLAAIDKDELDLAALKKKLGTRAGAGAPATGLYAERDALAPATTAYIQKLAKLGGWELPDTQSWFMGAIALLFVIAPAYLFAMTLKRRKIAPPSPPPPPPPPGGGATTI